MARVFGWNKTVTVVSAARVRLQVLPILEEHPVQITEVSPAGDAVKTRELPMSWTSAQVPEVAPPAATPQSMLLPPAIYPAEVPGMPVTVTIY